METYVTVYLVALFHYPSVKYPIQNAVYFFGNVNGELLLLSMGVTLYHCQRKISYGKFS